MFSFQCVSSITCRGPDSHISQAAKDLRSSQDALVNTFERVEMFSRRLEVYTEVPPTTEMTDHGNDGYDRSDIGRGSVHSRDCDEGNQAGPIE